MANAPSPQRIVPLLAELGTVSGHRLVLLSVEDWGEWFDLRFARIDRDGGTTLPRRIPPPHAWGVTDGDGFVFDVEDAVGRGDRSLSIGEVRVRPGLPDHATTLRIRVEMLEGVPELVTDVEIPSRDGTG